MDGAGPSGVRMAQPIGLSGVRIMAQTAGPSGLGMDRAGLDGASLFNAALNDQISTTATESNPHLMETTPIILSAAEQLAQHAEREPFIEKQSTQINQRSIEAVNVPHQSSTEEFPTHLPSRSSGMAVSCSVPSVRELMQTSSNSRRIEQSSSQSTRQNLPLSSLYIFLLQQS